ncbi:MAG: DNA repair protein RecO [Gemmatimonadota bacterium]
MAPVSTPAVLLRAHAYGETSRILRFYTRDHGLLSVMARGVRTRSGKGSTTLDTFATGELSAYVRPQRELHTMKDFACSRPRTALGADVLRFAGASAVAELVVAHTDQEPHPEVFEALESGLDLLEAAPAAMVPAACLSGAWRVVVAFGFAPELDACTRCGTPLGEEEVGRFDMDAGGVSCAACGGGSPGPRVGPGARAQLRALVSGRLDAPVTHPRRHLALLADFVAFHVANRPLKSIRFLGDLLPPDPEQGA